ncbi:MAG: DUF4360 domain-containing protein [Oligoflexus sp.]
MSMVRSLSKFLVPAALLFAAQSASANGFLPPQGSVKIKRLLFNGTGCPLGTVAENISADGKAFTVTFSEFFAEVGPGLPLSSGRRNCNLTAVLAVPAGWQFTVGDFFYRGFMDIDAGIRAEHTTNYFFEGQGDTGSFRSNEVGPQEKDFVYTDKIGLVSSYMPNYWSPCNVERALNINVSVRVSNTNTRLYPNAQGLITNDSIDGQLKQVFGLNWRPCQQ